MPAAVLPLILLVAAASPDQAAQPVPAEPAVGEAAPVAPEELGSFLELFYEDPKERRVLDDLEFHSDRLYIAHGYTNTKTVQQLVYYDVAAKRYGRHEHADGSPQTWRIEKLFKTRRFIGADGVPELFVLDYDPLSGPAKLLRVGPAPDYEVKTQHVSNDAHNRDVYAHGGALFVSHGRSDVPWPQMRWSRDDGATWEQIDQGDVAPPSLYQRYFTFRGRLYAGTHSKRWKEGYVRSRRSTLEEMLAAQVVKTDVPWLVRTVDPDDPRWVAGRPWEPVIDCEQAEAVLGPHPDETHAGSRAIHQAVDAGEAVWAAVSARLYRFTSFSPLQAAAIVLGRDTTVSDVYLDADGRVWVLAWDRPEAEGEAEPAVPRATALVATGAGPLRRVATWESPERPQCLAVRGRTAYVGYAGRLVRIGLPAAE